MGLFGLKLVLLIVGVLAAETTSLLLKRSKASSGDAPLVKGQQNSEHTAYREAGGGSSPIAMGKDSGSSQERALRLSSSKQLAKAREQQRGYHKRALRVSKHVKETSYTVLTLFLVAIIVFLLAEAPAFAAVIFALPVMMEIIATIVSATACRSLRLTQPKIRALKTSTDNKISRSVFDSEKEKVVRFLQRYNIKLDKGLDERKLYQVVSRYFKDQYGMQEKEHAKDLKKVAKTVMANSKKIVKMITDAV